MLMCHVYSSTMASLVLSDSSQLTADGFEKLPDQIIYLWAEPYDLQKHLSSKATIVKEAFYVPGVAPVEFKKGAKIDVKASLSYFDSLGGLIVFLGEVLRGDRIVNTPYEIRMAEDIKCQLLCHSPNNPINWNEEQSQKVISRIQHEYFVHLLVDNLPCATKRVNTDTSQVQYEHGYRLGGLHGDSVFINNHLKLILLYHSKNDDGESDKKAGSQQEELMCHVEVKPNLDNMMAYLKQQLETTPTKLRAMKRMCGTVAQQN
uniref:Transmembrane 9 superfamily member n=1 Tax=Timema douglasi TaxID=61478 RepID=A0A7R8V8L1_TIMDO|nr:unnamed protein product [Timema douglasi]